ncbi:hypothetical protein NB231_06261 [Nitrococcus mobilis Nb-231]|uniref:Glutaredoxin family protein n=1 Tax=Nitrococcus mobilis Nb-231 TaxID=314278 RepID=A4BQW9_9GAMM|nr:hypothetical protein NB231_06261 [Nitrococcus mobilis Nb-231]
MWHPPQPPTKPGDKLLNKRTHKQVGQAVQGDTTITVELLETSGCRLCGEAEMIVRSVLKRRRHVLRAVEIAGDPLLESSYVVRIPVLRRTDSGAELDWPFGPEDVYRFLL